MKARSPVATRPRRPPSPARAVALALLALAAFAPAAGAALEPRLASYLPAGVTYDPAVPTPAAVLGFEIGERPITPLELEIYLRRLAEVSDRVILEEQGRTHEGRPQLLLTVSSPANLERLEALRQAHLARSEGTGDAPQAADATLVVWLAYSIHGDETSGSNAAPLVAYHLAAARDPAVDALLAGTVVLLDPSQNPDGMARFSQWAISQRSAQPVASPVHREKNEPWPGDRGNHYWFDLNRDWLSTEQPESQSRVATFQRWRPHVVGDFHEMGSGGTYFFQPGVPERTHPLTPARNQELTAALARFHAAALDRAGRPYYTRESFDDFYYGKGSTYPDIQGGVGILFEQATTAGRVVETAHGVRDFPTTVHNQFLTSLSTLEGAHALRQELVAHQEAFYREALAEARRAPVEGWVCSGERGRIDGLARLLRRHGIELAGHAAAAGARPAAGEAAFVVPARQRQSRLLQALLERRTELATHVFYDISAWTLPLAWNVDCEALGGRGPAPAAGTTLGTAAAPAGAVHRGAAAVAYAFDWSPHLAPRALQRLLAAEVRVSAALKPLTLAAAGTERGFGAGALLIPLAGQELATADLERLLDELAAETGVDFWAVGSGLAAAGVDLGSPNVRPLVAPRPALLVGDGVQPAAAGAVWHHVDRHLGVPLVLLERSRVNAAALADLTHLLATDGSWDDLPAATADAVAAWVRAGGVLVALEAGARWAQDRVLPAPEGAPAAEQPAAGEGDAVPPLPGRYARHGDATAERLIAGAIVEVELDPSHPLAFGYGEPRLAAFRGSTLQLAPPVNAYDLVARYAERPVLAGFVSADNAARLAGSPALLATRLGRGLVVRFADDPVFRGAWHGTERLLGNALFFGSLVDERPASVGP